jgi:hypothetical protein
MESLRRGKKFNVTAQTSYAVDVLSSKFGNVATLDESI